MFGRQFLRLVFIVQTVYLFSGLNTGAHAQANSDAALQVQNLLKSFGTVLVQYMSRDNTGRAVIL
jgi:hypothetical protein